MNYAPDLTITAIKMVLSLALVLALLWGLYRWTRHRLPQGQTVNGGRLIQVLGTHYLGVKKSLTLVQVPGSVLVLGISADRINLLTQIDDPALIAGFRSPTEPKNAPGFMAQLQRLTRPGRSKWRPAQKQSTPEAL